MDRARGSTRHPSEKLAGGTGASGHAALPLHPLTPGTCHLMSSGSEGGRLGGVFKEEIPDANWHSETFRLMNLFTCLSRVN